MTIIFYTDRQEVKKGKKVRFHEVVNKIEGMSRKIIREV